MKNNVYTCKPQFYYIKVGFKGERGGGGAKLYRRAFVMFSDPLVRENYIFDLAQCAKNLHVTILRSYAIILLIIFFSCRLKEL